MNYIIFDLEWNQGSVVQEEAVKELPSEVIEIGAVKYDDSFRKVSQFEALIKPRVYPKLHEITEKLLQLRTEDLSEGEDFPAAAERFLSWCGEEAYIFCTWGTQDLTELQRNMKYYGMEPLSEGPIPFLDVQKLFAIACEDRKVRRTLEFAIDFLKLPKDSSFHRALGDADYTARVLACVQSPEVLKNVSYDVFNPPKSRNGEVKAQFDTYVKFISRQYDSREEAFEDKEVISSKCYLCHRNLRKKIQWFSVNGRHYYSVAFCEKHGYLKGKIRVRKTDEGKVYIVKTNKFITKEEAEEIARRKEHTKELRRQHRARQVKHTQP